LKEPKQAVQADQQNAGPTGKVIQREGFVEIQEEIINLEPSKA
jgi:hypothetical protein